MKSKERELHRLLGTVKDMELAQLSLISAEQEEMSLEIRNIRTAKYGHLRGSPNSNTLPVSCLAGVDQKWFDHLDQKLRNLNIDLAVLAAKKEAQIKRSRVALGRINAFQKVLKKNEATRVYRPK